MIPSEISPVQSLLLRVSLPSTVKIDNKLRRIQCIYQILLLSVVDTDVAKFVFKFLEDIRSFCEATDISVLDL